MSKDEAVTHVFRLPRPARSDVEILPCGAFDFA
jgi:hypothetical protein